MTTLDARTYAGGTHAGTLADPWPASAIKAALEALPQPAGGMVTIADGIWLCNSPLSINVSNFILQGNSLNSVLRFSGSATAQMWLGQNGAGFTHSALSTLTIDGGPLPTSSGSAVRISNPQFFSMKGCKLLGQQNGSVPCMFMEGGNDVTISGNTIVAGPGGGGVLQLQPLGSSLNTRYTVDNNNFDSCNIVIIGLDNCRITNNHMTNVALKNMIAIMVCGKWNTASYNNLVDGNTVDASNVNGAVISGLPNDPGGASVVNGFTITNNIVKGTSAYIAAQSLDNSNYLDQTLANNTKTNVTITGNQITSAWTGSKIDIRGGAGSVDHVLVQNNTLVGAAQNTIVGDTHTTNATVVPTGNTVLVGLTGGSGMATTTGSVTITGADGSSKVVNFDVTVAAAAGTITATATVDPQSAPAGTQRTLTVVASSSTGAALTFGQPTLAGATFTAVAGQPAGTGKWTFTL